MAVVTATHAFAKSASGTQILLHQGNEVPALAPGETDRLIALGAISADTTPSPKEESATE